MLPGLCKFEGLPFAQFKALLLLLDGAISFTVNLFFLRYLVVEGLVNTWVLGGTMDNARRL
jgi:hypothetical protein